MPQVRQVKNFLYSACGRASFLTVPSEAMAEKMMRSTFSQEEKQPGSRHGAQRPRSERGYTPQRA
jgi:hypothetical protein